MDKQKLLLTFLSIFLVLIFFLLFLIDVSLIESAIIGLVYASLAVNCLYLYPKMFPIKPGNKQYALTSAGIIAFSSLISFFGINMFITHEGLKALFLLNVLILGLCYLCVSLGLLLAYFMNYDEPAPKD